MAKTLLTNCCRAAVDPPNLLNADLVGQAQAVIDLTTLPSLTFFRRKPPRPIALSQERDWPCLSRLALFPSHNGCFRSSDGFLPTRATGFYRMFWPAPHSWRL